MHNMSMTEAFGSRVSLLLVVRERPFSIFSGDRVGALYAAKSTSRQWLRGSHLHLQSAIVALWLTMT